MSPTLDKLPQNAPTAVLLFGPGFSLGPERYQPLLARVQSSLASSFGVALWVGAAKLKFDLPLSVAILESALEDTFEQLKRLIQAAQPRVDIQRIPVYYAGHSRGGQLMLELVASKLSSVYKSSLDPLILQTPNAMHSKPVQGLPRATGLILLSSGIERKFRYAAGETPKLDPKLPILTISGELDGLFRVFRLAESFYHQLLAPVDMSEDMAVLYRPVVVMENANHMSMVSGSPVPRFVALNDIPADASPSDVQAEVAVVMTAFLSYHLPRDTMVPARTPSETILRLTFTKGIDYFGPIIQALELEGSYRLKPSCNEIVANDSRPCWKGSRWAEQIQAHLALLPKVQFNVQDALWKVYLVNPVHLPQVHSTCPQSDENCVLNVTTVSQVTYPLTDILDTGFSANSAFEIRSKFKSRQVLHKASGIKNASFEDLDDNNQVCRDQNALALTYAQEHAPMRIMARFQKRKGIQLQVGEDLGPYNAGPTWIWKDMQYLKKKDEAGKPFVEVRSPCMRTPDDYPIALARGFHYCKLLSPARALEWIYTDGLKGLSH